MTADDWNAKKNDWLPSADDRAFVASLMGRCVEPGQYAGWISPPLVPVNKQPLGMEYVRFG
jgi:benzoyl-CoA 2,3-dioxygenase component B